MDRIPNALAEFFSHRATVRRYTGETPSRELIDSILEAAMRAPTTGNMQLYSVVETRDAEMHRRLAELHFNQPAAAGAPLMLTFCADYYRFTRWCEVSDADAGYDNFLSFTSAMMDAVILTQQFVTLAELCGLGTCYLGTCLYNAPEIAELLKLPRLTVPVACISVGYPAEQPEPTERCIVSRNVSRTHGRRHRTDIQGQGRLRPEREIRGRKRQEDPCAGIHRRALSPRHERVRLRQAPRLPPPTRIYE